MLLLACSASTTVDGRDAEALQVDATPAALAGAMKARRNVLLGEVHDNRRQHELRWAALKEVLEAGGRPALAFEQFDRDMQGQIDRSRRDHPRDAEALIRAAGAKGWDMTLYRPYVQLALDYDLPIVAANLSRIDAMAVASSGWEAVFDDRTRTALALDRLPAEFIEAHEQAVARGHCNLLPATALLAMARAQIARDIVLAKAIQPQLARGVVLLTGNGHARRDIGVPVWLTADERRELTSIGIVEAGDEPDDLPQSVFDALVVTPAAERPDPCESLRRRALQTEPR